MSAPRYVACKCGHPYDWHPAEHDEACTDCGCQEYIPKTLQLDKPIPAALAAVSPDAIDLEPEHVATATATDDLIKRGKRSHMKRTANLAAKVEGLLVELAARLKEESAAGQVLAEIAALEAKLAAAKAKLKGGAPERVEQPATRRTITYGEFPCTADDCEHVSTTAAGRSAHFRFNHAAERAS